MTKENSTSQIVDMPDATTSLSRLVYDLGTGGAQEFIMARNGRPAARLVLLQAGGTDRVCRIGVAKGRFKVPDDIDRSSLQAARLLEGV